MHISYQYHTLRGLKSVILFLWVLPPPAPQLFCTLHHHRQSFHIQGICKQVKNTVTFLSYCFVKAPLHCGASCTGCLRFAKRLPLFLRALSKSCYQFTSFQHKTQTSKLKWFTNTNIIHVAESFEKELSKLPAQNGYTSCLRFWKQTPNEWLKILHVFEKCK